MNCNDVRKYFYAFLDDELDVEKNIEVLAHVDMCCECGQRMEKERLLQNRVRETVCEVKAPDYLVEAVLKGAEERPNFFVPFVRKFTIRKTFGACCRYCGSDDYDCLLFCDTG